MIWSRKCRFWAREGGGEEDVCRAREEEQREDVDQQTGNEEMAGLSCGKRLTGIDMIDGRSNKLIVDRGES